MRTALCFTLSAALVLIGACSKEPDTPATAAPVTIAPAPAAPVAAAPAAPAAPPEDHVFSTPELEQMLAPIALYPDALLSQVLMAATYPGELADAATWSAAHPDAKGDAAVKMVADQPWDPTVQALVAFPQALATLKQDPVWVQRLGDAFLAQPDDVMNTIQQLRSKAQAAGNLKSNEYQNVSVQPAAAPPAQVVQVQEVAAPAQTIVIEPAQPDVVYVPSYNPTTAYGSWGYPSYPPPYYPPPPMYYPGQALVNGLAFGAGIAVTSALWGGFNWGSNDVNINVNRYNNMNVNSHRSINQTNWNHNSAHRGGTPYRGNNTRQNYGNRVGGANQREAYRGGGTTQRDRSREQARTSMDRHGVTPPARTNAQARDSARNASQAQARDRASATADRSRNNSQARQNAPSAAQNRDRGNANANRGNTTNRGSAANRPNASQQNRQSAQNARNQSSSRGPKNNAFAGASQPSASRNNASRGHNSQAAAKRPPSSRSGGQQVNRSAPSGRSHSSPQRGGGGRHPR